MENNKRIYGTVSDINGASVQKLFDERAKEKKEGYISVLLGDQNPDYARQWDEFEKKTILPKLNLTGDNSFIDIGCGIGRWGETVIPLCQYYCGCDFSSEMIAQAQQRLNFPNADFIPCSFQQIGEKIKGKKFDRGIIAGVCMYINDSEIEECIANFIHLIDDHAILYLTETVAIEKRLTLNAFWSDAMHSEYSSIYRTPDEYNDLYTAFLKAGFTITEQGFLPHFNKEKEYSETDRWYTILQR